ncbi:hypothetical protein CHH83_20930 [Bacillus sp. 7586-K]|nr:hypothetical protein CHH83_20930 [Bacillus sp. 7586-K]
MGASMRKLNIIVLMLFFLTACSNSTTSKVDEKISFSLDSGLVTFIFDDGHKTFYNNAFSLFKDKGFVGSIAIDTKRWDSRDKNLMTNMQILEMQESGWEVMSHSVSHKNNTEGLNSLGWIVKRELKKSKEYLESNGFEVNQYVAPNSSFPLDKHKDLLQSYYQAGYTTYVNAKEEPIEKLVMSSPIDVYKLHRANMEGLSIDKLKGFIDYVEKNKVWLILYEHQIGGEERYTTTETLSELLDYIGTKNIEIVTGTQAIEIIKSHEIKSP